jgi:hypothetical protein
MNNDYRNIPNSLKFSFLSVENEKRALDLYEKNLENSAKELELRQSEIKNNFDLSKSQLEHISNDRREGREHLDKIHNRNWKYSIIVLILVLIFLSIALLAGQAEFTKSFVTTFFVFLGGSGLGFGWFARKHLKKTFDAGSKSNKIE